MTTFIREDSEEARKKMIKVPKELVSKAQAITTLIDTSDGNKRKKDGKTAMKGYKRMKKIVNLAQKDGSYNKSGENGTSTNDSNAYITFGDAKRAYHDMMHTPHSKDNAIYQANGGDEFLRMYKDGINRVRRSVKQTQKVPTVTKTSNIKTPKVNAKDLTTNVNGLSVHVNENHRKVYINEEKLNTLKSKLS